MKNNSDNLKEWFSKLSREDKEKMKSLAIIYQADSVDRTADKILL